MNDISQSINEKYNEMSEVGENYLPNDMCFALKFLNGAFMTKYKNVSAQFNFPIRCSSWNSLMEINELDTKIPILSISPLPGHYPNAKEVLIEQMNQTISKMEKLSGESFTNTKLQKACQMTEELKDIYDYLVFEVQKGDKYPCNAKTYAQMIVLFEIAFQDYISDLPAFLKIMKDLQAEIKKKIANNPVDVSSNKKILFATRYGGYDAYIEDLVPENGGRIVYADWYQIGFMERIKTTGDMIENYADYVQRYYDMNIWGNEEFSARQAAVAEKLDVGAVIFNQAFGCHSYTINYPILKDKLLKELGIPSTALSFNKIGEGREQMKTRVVALLEMM
jgi:benzoyl-CoA reductase/2-hydroxyglutaryl-CoA dehydratase subunit BcrC/BadD/HgdB